MFKLLGLLLALASLPLLFLNEGRAVHTARSLEEGAAIVVNVEPSPIKASHEGKLVHVTGPAATQSSLRDPVFGVEAKALQLSRRVEVYQWQEQAIDNPHGRGDESTDPVRGRSYTKVWADHVIPTGNSQNTSAHANPDTLPYPSLTLSAEDATMGDFQVPRSFIADLDGDFVPLPLDEKSFSATPNPPLAGITKAKLHQGEIYVGDDPAAPQIGDVRVRFTTKPLGEISVIGGQRGKEVEPYQTKAGRPVEMAHMGASSAREMFDGAMTENTLLTWLGRVGGYLLMLLGSHMVVKVRGLLRYIPVVGSAMNAGAGFLAFGFASVASLAVVSLAWIAYRPLLAGALLVAGAAIGAFAFSRARQKTVQAIPR